jgi:hypothetical protein
MWQMGKLRLLVKATWKAGEDGGMTGGHDPQLRDQGPPLPLPFWGRGWGLQCLSCSAAIQRADLFHFVLGLPLALCPSLATVGLSSPVFRFSLLPK